MQRQRKMESILETAGSSSEQRQRKTESIPGMTDLGSDQPRGSSETDQMKNRL